VKKLGVVGIVVISGPLYLPHTEKDGKKYVTYRVIGEGNVAVPTHFFKAIYYPVQKSNEFDYSISSEIYVIPNEDLNESVPMENFRTSLENFEKISGIILLKDEAIKSYLKALSMPPPRM
jgi:endonuclease G